MEIEIYSYYYSEWNGSLLPHHSEPVVSLLSRAYLDFLNLMHVAILHLKVVALVDVGS